jgi:hypothetical protein
MKELLIIQEKLNAPKNLKNSFWNYFYRSAETILEAVKPLLKETKTILLLSDEIIREENRFYIKATAKLINEDWKEISVTWYAREEEIKKGMDWSQITWASSSYARKYALNWLFAIDDEKDSDATNTHWNDWKKAQDNKVEEKETKTWLNYDTLKAIIDSWNTTDQQIAKIIKEDWYSLSWNAKTAIRDYLDTWLLKKDLFFTKK